MLMQSYESHARGLQLGRHMHKENRELLVTCRNWEDIVNEGSLREDETEKELKVKSHCHKSEQQHGGRKSPRALAEGDVCAGVSVSVCTLLPPPSEWVCI